MSAHRGNAVEVEPPSPPEDGEAHRPLNFAPPESPPTPAPLDNEALAAVQDVYKKFRTPLQGPRDVAQSGTQRT